MFGVLTGLEALRALAMIAHIHMTLLWENAQSLHALLLVTTDVVLCNMTGLVLTDYYSAFVNRFISGKPSCPCNDASATYNSSTEVN